jgi:hypothetical protein
VIDMTEDTTSATISTRASLLKRLGLLATGALGGGIAVSAARGGAEAAPAAEPAVRTKTTRELRLYGRDWRLQRPGVEFGKLPEASDPAVPSGRIVDGRERELGRFRAAALPGVGAFHLHTFDLAEGTILGIGANMLDEGSYAIVGGTGRFAGASGTYTARQFLRELGGDGTAEFTLNLTAWEA